MTLYDELRQQLKQALNGKAPQWDETRNFNWALDFFDQVNPSRKALVETEDLGREFSYGDLSRRSNALAHHFIANGLSAGDRVMIVMENGLEFYITMLALMKVKCFFVPCYSALGRADLEQRKKTLRPSAIIAEAGLVEASSFEDLEIKLFWPQMEMEAVAAEWQSLVGYKVCPDHAIGLHSGPGNAPMMGIFTSGTTSAAKLVAHTHVSYPIGHLASAAWQGIGASDRHMNLAHPGWAKHSWSSFFVPFNSEACVILPPKQINDTKEFEELLDVQGVTSLCAPPSTWRRLARGRLSQRPRDLRNLTAAGEPLSETTLQSFARDWGLTLRNGYGQSEMTAVFGDMKIPKCSRKPLPGYEGLVLLDEDGQPDSKRGEIAFDLNRPPIGLMAGYMAPDGQTSFADQRWYKTGDIAECDAGERFRIVGRVHSVFKSYDVKISPEEIEKQLLCSGLLSEILVFEDRDQFNEPVPSGLAIPSNAEIVVDDIVRWQKTNISPAFHLRNLSFVAALARNTSGKLIRNLS